MVHFHANNRIVCLCSLHCSCVLNIMHEFEVGRFLDKDRQKRNVMIWFRQAFSLRLSLEKTVSLCPALSAVYLLLGCCVAAGFCSSLTPLHATGLHSLCGFSNRVFKRTFAKIEVSQKHLKASNSAFTFETLSRQCLTGVKTHC